jgi:transposase-like protein
VARYGQAFKERAVARLLPPESAAITAVSQELGVSVSTLERWRADALSRPRCRQRIGRGDQLADEQRRQERQRPKHESVRSERTHVRKSCHVS